MPAATLSARPMPVLLLCCSNVFMTFAWYGRLKFKDRPLWLVILASWLIAFFEYCLAVRCSRPSRSSISGRSSPGPRAWVSH